MAWHVVDPDADRPYVELVLSGSTDAAEMWAAFTATSQSCMAHRTLHVLCDVSGLGFGHSVIDLHSLVSAMAGPDPAPPGFREAVLVGDDPDTMRLAEFFETAAVNRGVAVRNFTERDAAVAWLREAP